MTTIEKISIALPADMLAVVREAVQTGDYASSSEVVREALRQWKTRRAVEVGAIEDLRRRWEEGLRSGAAEPLDMAVIKRRARARLNRRDPA